MLYLTKLCALETFFQDVKALHDSETPEGRDGVKHAGLQDSKALNDAVMPEGKDAVEHAGLQDSKALNDAEKPEGRDTVEHVGHSENPNSKTGNAWGYMSSRSIQHVDIHAPHIITRLRESEHYNEDHLLRKLSAPSTISPHMCTRVRDSSKSPEYSPLRRRSLESGVSPTGSYRSRCRRSSQSLKGQPGAINRTDIIYPITLLSPKGIPVPYAPHFGGVTSSGFELVGGYFAQEPPGNGYGSYMLMRKVDNKVTYTVKV